MSAQVRFLPSDEVLPQMRLPRVYKKWVLEWQVGHTSCPEVQVHQKVP